MNTINVVAAIIIDHYKLFTTQRGYGDFKDGWELPGGKVNKGETPEEALIREIQEELNVKVEITSEDWDKGVDTIIEEAIKLAKELTKKKE